MDNFKFFFAFSFLLILSISSCFKKECEYKSKYIYEELVYDDNCNCIVSGKVKYLKECETVALVDYGNGECDNIATKTVCIDGKCETSAGAYTEDFEFDCQESFKEGAISDEEALELGI